VLLLRSTLAWSATAAAVVSLAACGGPVTYAPTQATPHAAIARSRALAALDRLPVKGRAPRTGYSRARFGGAWGSVDGCDMRDRMLRRDLRGTTYADGRRCEVATGTLDDPYTRRAIAFVRGRGDDVDVDHVVALGDAWQKGAQQWSAGRRIAFANDPANLLTFDASANRQKGDGDAATWLPRNRAFRCAYVARQIAMKRKYGAWVTAAERDAMRRVLAACPTERLPAAGRLRVQATQTGSRSGAPVYRSCDAVRAAGVAPLRRGTPAYAANRHLDRDGDGAAC
jgi:Excalibur calcium-binding domain/Protein of unknown function (DUF1524)